MVLDFFSSKKAFSHLCPRSGMSSTLAAPGASPVAHEVSSRLVVDYGTVGARDEAPLGLKTGKRLLRAIGVPSPGRAPFGGRGLVSDREGRFPAAAAVLISLDAGLPDVVVSGGCGPGVSLSIRMYLFVTVDRDA